MTKKALNAFKGAILAFGFIVYAISVALFTRGREAGSREIYLFTIIGIVYLAFFIPALFNSLTFGNFARNAAGVVILWNADIVFCFVSVALALTVYFGRLAIEIAVVIELVMLFAALILVFISAVSSGHIEGVGKKEEKLLKDIKEIRSTLASLDALCDVEGVSGDIKKRIKVASEAARYMTPVDSAQASSLEKDILLAVGECEERLKTVKSGADEGALKESIGDLEMKMAQRKLLRG